MMMNAENRMPVLLGVEEVAAYLGGSAKHVYVLISNESLRAVKIGQGWKLREADLAEYVNGLFER